MNRRGCEWKRSQSATSQDIILKELRNMTLNSLEDIRSLGQDSSLGPPEYKNWG
jgi:hypothetical protein